MKRRCGRETNAQGYHRVERGEKCRQMRNRAQKAGLDMPENILKYPAHIWRKPTTLTESSSIAEGHEDLLVRTSKEVDYTWLRRQDDRTAVD